MAGIIERLTPHPSTGDGAAIYVTAGLLRKAVAALKAADDVRESLQWVLDFNEGAEHGGLCDADGGVRGTSLPYQTDPLSAVMEKAAKNVSAYDAAKEG